VQSPGDESLLPGNELHAPAREQMTDDEKITSSFYLDEML
jgi:hypothetical protein